MKPGRSSSSYSSTSASSEISLLRASTVCRRGISDTAPRSAAAPPSPNVLYAIASSCEPARPSTGGFAPRSPSKQFFYLL